jgi:DNA-binding GntR family transcriptional regulator
MNETLEQVRFEFDLVRLAMKLNAGRSAAAQLRTADVDEIEATLENLRATVAASVPVPIEVLGRKLDSK